jgi:hypothetical protein
VPPRSATVVYRERAIVSGRRAGTPAHARKTLDLLGCPILASSPRDRPANLDGSAAPTRRFRPRSWEHLADAVVEDLCYLLVVRRALERDGPAWKVELVDARLVRCGPSRMVVDQPKAGGREDEFDTVPSDSALPEAFGPNIRHGTTIPPCAASTPSRKPSLACLHPLVDLAGHVLDGRAPRGAARRAAWPRA